MPVCPGPLQDVAISGLAVIIRPGKVSIQYPPLVASANEIQMDVGVVAFTARGFVSYCQFDRMKKTAAVNVCEKVIIWLHRFLVGGFAHMKLITVDLN
jgi:hypothetical protein